MVGRPKSRARKLAAEGQPIPAGLLDHLTAREKTDTPRYRTPLPEVFRHDFGAPYNPAICQAIIEHSRRGHTLTATAAILGLRASTIINWASSNPELECALACARELRQAFFEGELIDIAQRGGDATRFAAIKMALINTGEDWRDRSENNVSVQFSLAGLVTESLKLVGSRTIESTAVGQLEQDEKPKGPENGE
jgi:hypothetical protein